MALETDNQQNLLGKFTIPVIDEDAKNDNPWHRNYHQPPRFKKLEPHSFPVLDIRPDISRPEYTPQALLKSHGFGVVKHESSLFENTSPDFDDGEVVYPSEQTIVEKYYPEMKDLIIKELGAKEIYITHSIVRGGEVPEVYKLPTGLNVKPHESQPDQKKGGKVDSESNNEDYDRHIHVSTGQPIRVPHQDYTPLGARQSLRHQRQDIYQCALESGILEAEDGICDGQPFSAESKESENLIFEKYNSVEKLGPRYAAYSIWRPLKKVQRDPLALCPRTKFNQNDSLIYWPYLNKVPGHPDLGGDFLKEYAILGLDKFVCDSCGNNDFIPLKWYYVSEQRTDEVLFIKLFDSAALGENTEHAGAPWHASPDLGDAKNGEPRESIELRVMVFW
ncbi:GA4 desaturase [Talaromyces proteolyticus]|uniref:GA4 desaturase n=1 Tax=Talaromyces proteolyticus TaxID=1131652 RepID=A0AAD4KRW3_9EURO|nr:GA4 desaturase [Talaromyces proteolyticus]KAH8697865.1 GA4 desaturase [Talaromyces proteolyticus]